MYKGFSPENLREVFDYFPDSGILVWKHRVSVHAGINSRLTNKAAGGLQKDGYVRVYISGVSLYAHRVAWMIIHGEIPAGMELDHINMDRADNRLARI